MATETRTIVSMDDILSSFFAAIIDKENSLFSESPLLAAMRNLYAQKPTAAICSFCLDDEAIAEVINQLKGHSERNRLQRHDGCGENSCRRSERL